MLLYTVCIFVSAFLLFQVQPMISRFILPFFGGTPMVWSTVQLFFQLFLTVGYAYSAWMISRVPVKNQRLVHISLLAVALVVLFVLGVFWPSPVTPSSAWKPTGVDTPILDIFKLLIVAVGLPYFLLCTNSPLIQAWFNRALPGRSPYRLYALSNIGSLLGLLVYPFLIEPNLTLRAQGWVWAAGFLLFAVLAGIAAFRSSQFTSKESEPAAAVTSPRSGKRIQTMWILFSAVASTLLLAITNQITQEVAAVPFLWVLPLSIYLVTFILTYSGEKWYNRKFFGVLLVIASAGMVWALVDVHSHFVTQIGIYSFLLFVGAMICNGETYRLRPPADRLTQFYLMTAIGGAMGGVFVNLVAPALFKGFWELPISIGLTWALVLSIFVSRKSTDPEKRLKFLFNVMVGAAVILVCGLALFSMLGGAPSGDVFQERNFYGVTRVKEIGQEDPEWHGYNLVHGVTIHGVQYTAADKRDLPTGYYADQSGVGLAIKNHPKFGKGMMVGIIGLGMGGLSAYSQAGDNYRYYEINPIMKDLALGLDNYFSYIEDSPAKTEIVMGDARISMERELADGTATVYDVLVMDAFSGDSIPVHLLTKEAFEVYLKQLSPEGILVANISNRHLNMIPVFWKQAQNFGLHMVVIPTEGDGKLARSSLFVLLARDPALLKNPAIAARAETMEGYTTTIPQWTDDFSNLFQILR
jgi:spermidine synthase